MRGQLGPDQGLVDAEGNRVAIDIEGLMYFDVKREHVLQRLSLTAGPLRLLDGDFPDRTAMAGVAEHNLKQALELAQA